ncbi:MAG: tRNA modification GTPase [Peptococcaceae bacterium BICA1-7]|nr:MAG: tRNA modification GTPase [Peptococcaceae bacterium BICA1-7]HBV97921.1 tRNA uridine-5-carboxymethylaminomethyl(34) synthesis GTPase MnmE [Desulfotomaculum sp.]
MLNDTIAAISTPPGEGGVGIIRISGERALDIAEKVFRPARSKDWRREGFKLHYGHAVDTVTGEVIDEVLLAVMKAPHTYTREDVVEINCHGGAVPLRAVLKTVLTAGARLAAPGEFTRRAFLSGRIDLTQAESVIDVIRSKTEASLKVAMSQLGGGLSAKIRSLQDRVLGMLAQLEASIDFPEDDVDEKSRQELRETAGEIIGGLDRLLEAAARGRIYREGIMTVIAGRPNVGKSSLLNALLGRERAIVTDVPGTTRDVIEETINIRGIPLVLADTAGLRETGDLVEKIGVEKTRQTIEEAGLILFVIDAAQGVTGEDCEIIKTVDREKTILIINKIDVEESPELPLEEEWSIPRVEISALKGEGIEILEEKIEHMVTGGRTGSPDSIIVSNIRHESALVKARGSMEEFMSLADEGVPPDLLSIDVRGAWETLGEITGSTVTEDLLDRIFNDFCIGK